MLDAQQWVVERLKTRTLPDDVTPFVDLARNGESGCFELQENTYWDYKDRFPHSMSDDYFWGICRLICGLHNRYGGLIIFGVHDVDRTPGHNRVTVDIERLNTRLRELLNEPVECSHRRYSFSTGKPLPATQYQNDGFDLVLVPKRKFSTPVVRFRTDTGRYKSSDIFIRQNHEVVRAKSADITELYSPRSSFGLEQEDSEARIPSMLPQRPSVLRHFIGRTRVLDDVFAWFVTREDARAFLHGAGGSGKSTIAFEFASIVGRHGADIRIYQDWIAMERRTDASVHGVCTVCDKVLAADWIKDDEKPFFHFAQAVVQYNHGRTLMALSSPDAFGCLVDAMNHHLLVWAITAEADKRGFERSEEYSINTMHNLILVAKRLGFEKQLVQYIEDVCGRKGGMPVDPIAQPLIDFTRSLNERGSKAELDRIFGYLSRIETAIEKAAPRFRSKVLANTLLQNVDIKKRNLRESLKTAKA